MYRDGVIMNSPLAKSFLRLNPTNKDSLRATFNTTRYVLKKERLFTDHSDLLNLVRAIQLLMHLLTLLITLGK